MNVIEEIKNRVSVENYMTTEHGATIRNNRCRSFRPGATNETSLHLDGRWYYDFGSSEGGDVIDLCCADKGISKGEAIRYLANTYGIQYHTPQKYNIVFDTQSELLDDAVSIYHQNIPEIVKAYIKERGVKEDTIKELRLGFSVNPCEELLKTYSMEEISSSGITSFLNRIIIPYLDYKGKARYIIGRASPFNSLASSKADAKYIKLHRTEYNEHPIWGVNTLRRQGAVIIAEGAFDAISCYQEGYPVLSAITGAFSSEQKKDLYDLLKGRECIVCMDYDPDTQAGQKFTERLAQDLFDHGIRVKTCFLKSEFGGKVDISELYSKSPCKETLEEIFAKAVDYEYLFVKKTIKSLEKTAVALKKICSLRGSVYLSQFRGLLESVFDKNVASSLIAEAKKGVTEYEAYEEFAKRCPTFRHIHGVGDIYYQDDYGKYALDQVGTKAYTEVSKIYGKSARNRTIDAVVNHIRSLNILPLVEMEECNDIFNFRNCLYKVSTKEVIQHSPDYYSLTQLGYTYDENADCPRFKQFLFEIFDGVKEKVDLVQELLGYCLLNDCRYQVSFLFTGNGSNGKSVLMEVMNHLFHQDNISYVSMSQLASDFGRFLLRGKKVNIATEIKSDVRGTEEIFKQLVCGEPTTGSLKHKDIITFSPTCKFIFSVNDALKTTDVSDAYFRRYIVIDFPMKFVTSTPKAPNERKADVTLKAKLFEELPGIFNFAVQGLDRLQRNKGFTTTAEQEKNIKELKELNNPLLVFIDDEIKVSAQGKLWNKEDIWRKYIKWCEDNRFHPRSSTSFWMSMRKHINVFDTRVAGIRKVHFHWVVEDEE